MATNATIYDQGGLNVASSSQLPALDASKITDLEAEIGLSNVKMLLGMLADELRQRPAIIARLIDIGNFEVAAGEAHSLKGAAGGVGADRIANAARDIEVSLRDATAKAAELSRNLMVAASETLMALDERTRLSQ